MGIKIQIARCVWPGRNWGPDRFNQGKEKISATFVLDEHFTTVREARDLDKKDERVFSINVRIDEGTPANRYPFDAKRLLALRAGQTVSVVKMKAKHDYWLLVEYPPDLQQLMRDGLTLRKWQAEAAAARQQNHGAGDGANAPTLQPTRSTYASTR